MANGRGPRGFVRFPSPRSPGRGGPFGGIGRIFGGIFGIGRGRGRFRFPLPGFDFPISIIFRPRRPRRPRPRRPFDEQIPELFQPPQPVPVPTVPPVAGTRVPASPVSVGQLGSLGRVITGGAVAVGVITIEQIVRRALENQAKEEERERRAERQLEERRRGRLEPLPEITFPDPFELPEPQTQPEIVVAPDLPTLPDIRPAVPEPLPDIVELPGISDPLPEILVEPQIEIPTPTIPVPAPARTRVLEVVTPTIFDLPLFGPQIVQPVRRVIESLPSPTEPLTPINTPVPSLPVPGVATGLVPSTVPFPEAEPQPQPEGTTGECVCPPRRCDDEVDEPRVECFKGLYREGPLETDFTQWQEIDCLTGRELN